MTEPRHDRGGGSAPARGRPAERVRELALQAVSDLGLQLVQLTYRKEGRRWMVRLTIERPDGSVSLDDCARASEQFGTLLDMEDAIQHSYTLEVSSPGLDRPLLGESDYIRFTGHLARLKTHRPIDGQRNFLGTIASCASGNIAFDLADGRRVDIPLDAIASARLEVDADLEFAAPRAEHERES